MSRTLMSWAVASHTARLVVLRWSEICNRTTNKRLVARISVPQTKPLDAAVLRPILSMHHVP